MEDRQRQIREDIAKGVEILKGRKQQQKKDLDLEAQLKEILQKEGLFAVALVSELKCVTVNRFRFTSFF